MVPAGQRARAESAPNSLGLPPSPCSLSYFASAEKNVIRGFDECGSDAGEANRSIFPKLSLSAFRCLLY